MVFDSCKNAEYHEYVHMKGQVENAEVRKPKYRNGSTETEVRK